MRKSSTERRSSVNPVRISLFDRDKSLTRTDSRRTQSMKPKPSFSSVENSHIPKPRIRSSSNDRTSRSNLKPTAKSSLGQYLPTTPVTPARNASKHHIVLTGSSNRVNIGLPLGRRSPSGDRVSNISAKGPRKDIRPLTEKTYQSIMLHKIDTYFLENQCSSMLNNNGSLKPITLKMFVEVSAFLVKLLEIKQILTITNYVEELPKIAKKLHYPGIVTKSWLKTASAMHSWPNVLGWLSWLVEVCEIRALAINSFQLETLPFTGTEKEIELNQNTFFSMLNFYNAWNDEKLDEEAMLINKYLQDIECQQGVTEQDLVKARSEVEEETIKLETVEEKSKDTDIEVEHLRKILTSLQEDEAKQLDDIKAKEEYINNMKIKTDQINAKCTLLNEQISLQSGQHKELISIIKQQPMSKIERDKILEKCMEMQNYMQQFDEHFKDMQKELYTLDIKLASVSSNLNKAILTYNKEIFMQLSNDVGLNLEELKMPERGILNADVMDMLQVKATLLNDTKEALKKQITEKEYTLEVDNNNLEVLQEKMKVLQESNNDFIDKQREKKNYINKMKIETKAEESKLRGQIKTLQVEVKKIQESIPNLQKVIDEVGEATDKLDAIRRRKVFIEESAKRFFDQFYEILGEHRKELHDILTRK